MNTVDAAYKVLQEAGKPLHYKDIARRVIQSKLWQTSGKTPEITINRDINQEIMHRGKLARFVRLGDGVYAAVSQAALKAAKAGPPELAFVSDAWGHLPTAAKQKVLQVIRAALTGQTNEVDDPVIAAVLPDGPRAFPADFLDGDVGPTRTIELPEEELVVRHLADGGYVVESHFGFRLEVRNETEGMFIVRAHARGARTVQLPDEMIYLFKAVKGYEAYLRGLWRDLYQAYGRECGDRGAAYHHAKSAFDILGLPPPAENPPPAVVENDEPARRRRKLKRGARTPETAFYVPILQALSELGGSAKTADAVNRVGEIMESALLPDDREPLPSTGMPRWENTSQFARYSMVRSGLLKSGSPRGVWAISAKGLEYLRRHQHE